MLNRFVYLLIIIVGLLTISKIVLANSSNSINFEAENGSLSGNVNAVSDINASGNSAIQFTNDSARFVHPGVVFTKTEIDSWSTSSPEYTRLASTCAGNLNPTTVSCIERSTPITFGTSINSNGEIRNESNELNLGYKHQSGFAKIQAVLWAADNNNARREKVISYLDKYRTVTSLEWDPVEQYRLVSGWSCTNLAQAAEIINYQDIQFKRFLKEVCYPVMDWVSNPNWHASFADSKLAIAAYLGDEELWADAKAYFNIRIKQSIFHRTYDGDKVNPMRLEDKQTPVYDSSGVKIGTLVPARIFTGYSTPNLNSTLNQWGKGWGVPQINNDYTFNSIFTPLIDGVNAERMRDLAHVNMSYAAWVNGARTIRAQGEQLESHAYARLLAGWGYHAQRVLTYAQTGTIPNPNTYNGDGGVIRFQGYYPARKFFAAETPKSILDMLQLPDVKNFAAAGALHMVGEAFTDSQ
jgi:hypothetical protein